MILSGSKRRPSLSLFCAKWWKWAGAVFIIIWN